jgi:hypothetical protein
MPLQCAQRERLPQAGHTTYTSLQLSHDGPVLVGMRLQHTLNECAIAVLGTAPPCINTQFLSCWATTATTSQPPQADAWTQLLCPAVWLQLAV